MVRIIPRRFVVRPSREFPRTDTFLEASGFTMSKKTSDSEPEEYSVEKVIDRRVRNGKVS